MLPQPPLWLILIAFICMIGPLVFFHELGHYLVGRMFCIPAETFSIGFGHEIVGWTDKQGTRWKVGWLPLGGYVKFVGDMSPASTPVANFLLAILIFAAFFTLIGAPLSNIVGEVEPGTAAAEAGLQPGDKILSVADRATPTFDDIRSVVMLRPNETVLIRFERGQSVREVQATLQSKDDKDFSGKAFRKGQLGVVPTMAVLQPMSVFKAVPAAVDYTAMITITIIDGLGKILTGQMSSNTLGGPITIATAAGASAASGPLAFFSIAALLSINLGFINLLPVPMLDGGHLFFYAVEAVRRRPLSAKALDWAFRGGLAIILALLVFTTINDLGSLGLWDRLQRLIG